MVLTRQFRLPAFINGCADGYLIEACAGLLDGDDPETCIRKEAEQETGYRIRAPQKVFEAYMSPGSVTEKLHFFVRTTRPKTASQPVAVWLRRAKTSRSSKCPWPRPWPESAVA